MISLTLRNLFFTVLQPGVVTGFVPYLILRQQEYVVMPPVLGLAPLVGFLLAIAGLFILLICIARFVTEGKGTLSPVDPTKSLVVTGLYRYSRNPMYIGVLLILVGESVFWKSIELVIYSIAVFLAFSFFIRLHEEPRLTREFGSDYDVYISTVRRWL